MNRQRRWSSRFAVRVGTFWLLDRNSGGGLLRGSERERRERVRVRVRCCKARRGVAWRGVARRAAAAARDLLLLPGEAWRARRVVMTPHAEKLLVTHRGGSEPERSTCRMTG